MVEIIDLGLRPYREVWELQRNAQRALIEAINQEQPLPEKLFFCQHPAVITLGTSSKLENILCSEEELQRLDIETIQVERGGDVTFHGPGQLVAYPILNLATRKKDVAWYMRALEEIVIKTLADFDLKGMRITGKTGVWIDQDTKIASIGVRISRWCSMHGLALNVSDCSFGFKLLNPCGFNAIKVSCLAAELKRQIDLSSVQTRMGVAFKELLL